MLLDLTHLLAMLIMKCTKTNNKQISLLETYYLVGYLYTRDESRGRVRGLYMRTRLFLEHAVTYEHVAFHYIGASAQVSELQQRKQCTAASRLWGSDPSTDIHAKWLKRRVFTQGWYFCSKNRNFSYPLMFRTPKRSKFRKFLDFENFRSIWPLTLEVQREYTPYSSSEPNESGIVNTQSGGKKLKYVLKFYIGGTHHVISRMRNYDLAPGNRMVTWPMTSRDPESSRSWPEYC